MNRLRLKLALINMMFNKDLYLHQNRLQPVGHHLIEERILLIWPFQDNFKVPPFDLDEFCFINAMDSLKISGVLQHILKCYHIKFETRLDHNVHRPCISIDSRFHLS